MLLAGLTAAAFATSGRPRDPVQLVCLAVAAWQAVAHLRHIPFFAVLAGFWLPPQLEVLLGRSSGESAAPRTSRRALLRPALAVVAALVLATTLGAQLSRLRVDKAQYPVEAFAFMAAHEIAGRAVVVLRLVAVRDRRVRPSAHASRSTVASAPATRRTWPTRTST